MNPLGNIVFLSGLTSTGKTSIIKEIISRKSRLFFVLGYDLFEETVPEYAVDNGTNYANAIVAMYHAARGFSEQGCDVLIDGLIFNIPGLEEHYKTLQSIFAGYPLKIVHVHCPLEVCRQRNIARGDRRAEQSHEQSKIVEDNIPYFLELNTAESSISACADELLSHI